MTEGTSKGLFIVVAIVIFGIFVFMADQIFGIGLTDSLIGLVSDSVSQPNNETIVDPDEGNSDWVVGIKDEDIIIFEDDELAKVVANALGVSDDVITYGDLKRLTTLTIPNGSVIKSFKGIEYASNLKTLNLGEGTVANGDTNLLGYIPMFTVVQSESFKDNTPQKNVDLPSSKVIFIRDVFLRTEIRKKLNIEAPNPITMGDLEKLTDLSVQNKNIIYLDGIELAKNMVRIDVSHNYITDISYLNELKKLTYVDLGYNLINLKNYEGTLVPQATIKITEGNW